jgi:hypothetical protein
MTAWMKNVQQPDSRRPSEQFLEFLRAILAEPRHAGAQMHLLVDSWGVRASAVARAYFAQQPSIRLQVAPRITPRSDWGNWVTCWLRAIAAWPLQTSFIETAFEMRELLRQDRGSLGSLIIS